MFDRKKILSLILKEKKKFPRDWARDILMNAKYDILEIVSAAGEIRQKFFGKKVRVHQINNVQNGLCPEDCGYCGQGKGSSAPVNKYPLKSEEDIIAEAREAKSKGVFRYCMVSSGTGPSMKRVEDFARIIGRIKKEVGIETCLSAGFVSEEQAKVLKSAGLDRLNHNLNTSERCTKDIVSTHSYEDRLETLRNAKKVGLKTCSGMIVGMTEEIEDILDVAYELLEQRVPSIPINFLVPIEGNRIKIQKLSPLYCLKVLCVFRFINPNAEIRIGAGREGHLRALQGLALYPANSLFVDGYLLTKGFTKEKTYKMIMEMGFEVEGLEGLESETGGYELEGHKNILNPKTMLNA